MKLHLYKLPLFFFTVLVLAASCKKEYETIEEIDSKSISDYISQSGSTYTKNDSLNIWYNIVKPGSGADLKFSEIVPLVFTVRSLDGRYVAADTFAASNRYGSVGEGFSSNDYLGYFGAEKGYPNALKYAVVNFLKKRGGEVKVIVPSRFAYGIEGNSKVPGNASLEYDIRVINEKEIINYDDLSIKKFMTANNLTGFDTVRSGNAVAYYKIISQGTGSTMTKDSTISFTYSGRLFNGSVFSENSDSDIATNLLSDLIPAWQLALPKSGLKEGGSMRIILPSSMGYGLNGSRSSVTGLVTIPPASCLDFDLKVTDVTK